MISPAPWQPLAAALPRGTGLCCWGVLQAWTDPGDRLEVGWS